MILLVLLPLNFRSQMGDLRHDRTDKPLRPAKLVQVLAFLL